MIREVIGEMKNYNPTHNLKPENFIPVHVGLMGHIDAGKTALAERLTEIRSTSGLDKHPQSQKRGITIDLGFTFFPIKNYMVTLVDAPGHADLIKSVVSGANIIDVALLVIDAQQGPQIQTGEHLIILDLLAIPKLIVIINKIDLVPSLNRDDMINNITNLLKNTRFHQNTPILFVSSKTGEGIPQISDQLFECFRQLDLSRPIDTPFLYLIDHHFGKKGQGTIVTGTAISGKARIGDDLTILPLNLSTKIKSVQKWKNSVQKIQAGDRCGISITDVHPDQLFRGCLLTNKVEAFLKTQWLNVEISLVSLYKHKCKFGQEITVTHYMRSIIGRIFPYHIQKDASSQKKFWCDVIPPERHFNAIIWLEDTEYFQNQDYLLFSRLDLSPKSLRILGKGRVNEVLHAPIILYKKRIKKGIVKNATYKPNSIIVSGLSQSKTGAETLLQKQIQKPYGRVISTFGQKGNVEIQIERNGEKSEIKNGDSVILEELIPFEIIPHKSYDFLSS